MSELPDSRNDRGDAAAVPDASPRIAGDAIGGAAEDLCAPWRHRAWRRLWRHPLRALGPGLVTGVADDDPSGIATYSQAGAQFGLNMLWTMPVAYPLMSAVQSICARIGRVTGMGLAANMMRVYPGALVRALVLLLLIANTLNIAADIAAMGACAELITGIGRHVMTPVFVALTLALQIFVPYHRYVVFLKWLTASLLAYAAVLFVVHVPWADVARHTVLPHFVLDGTSAAVVLGIFGTTISPYLFFWQASEEVEDLRGGASLLAAPGQAASELGRIGWDTWTGMLYSDVTSYAIILATAVTLHASGIQTIATAADAASALKPLAGSFAAVTFAVGILGVGMIGVPVLAGSAGYAMAETMGWASGLERRASDARGFYAVIAVSVLAAIGLQFTPIGPIQALFWSAVINGVVAVPILVAVIRLSSMTAIMGPFAAPRTIRWLAWSAAALMGAAAVGMFWTLA